ncbi:MAG: glutamyl-tRNA reductase [Deltaproteobacteria bacterium HGW-Deltaproteobacteria-21]|nr:MAG: glutamyl-tRNA reductase [Deltaproteobacteria bacterium HGW-Deltaproteobacteria-21]
MLKILDIGMNHETAPVEIRECLVKEPGNVGKALAALRESPFIHEGLFLSTCNRVEAFVVTENPQEARRSIVSLMSSLGSIEDVRFIPNLFTFEDNEAVRHIFRVSCSLDSMVMGEPQILGQVKDAYSQASKAKTSGVVLNRLMHRAFHVAKRVRTETGISDSAVSISYAAVELARKIFHDLDGRKVLLVGAGEMAELAARHLVRQGCALFVSNRTLNRAVDLAQLFGGKPVAFDEMESLLLEMDIVITSTSAPGFVIGHDQLKSVLRKRRSRPLFFIDIAVPRDVEPKVNDLGNVYVYDIDDLKGVVEVNKAQRRQEGLKAERIVEEEVIRFEKWLKTLQVVPTIVSLKEKAETIRQAEVKRSLANLGDLTPEQVNRLEILTRSIAEKIMHDPILYLKRKAGRPTRDACVDMTRKLFNLDSELEEEEEYGLSRDDSGPKRAS